MKNLHQEVLGLISGVVLPYLYIQPTSLWGKNAKSDTAGFIFKFLFYQEQLMSELWVYLTKTKVYNLEIEIEMQTVIWGIDCLCYVTLLILKNGHK